MLNEEVRTIMTPETIVVSPDQTISEIEELMLDSGMQQIPVVDGKQFLGLITTHDLWVNTRGTKNPGAKLVKDVMNKRVIKITPKDKLGTAAELFMDKRFRTLPIVNLRNELKGVITSHDVMRYIMKKEYKQPILYKDIING